jgi:hypothetical protein
LGFAFLLPPESGERIGFCTTILLSIVVYLTIIQGQLPEASEPNVSILGYILVSYVASGAVLVVLVIISLRIHNAQCGKPVPLCIALLVKCCCRRRLALDVVEPIESKSENLKDDEDNEVTWTEVGRCFDKVCFVTFIIQFIVTVTTFMILTSP